MPCLWWYVAITLMCLSITIRCPVYDGTWPSLSGIMSMMVYDHHYEVSCLSLWGALSMMMYDHFYHVSCLWWYMTITIRCPVYGGAWPSLSGVLSITLGALIWGYMTITLRCPVYHSGCPYMMVDVHHSQVPCISLWVPLYEGTWPSLSGVFHTCVYLWAHTVRMLL